MTTATDQPPRSPWRTEIFICALLCLLPLAATQMPRLLVLGPGAAGLALLIDHRLKAGAWPELAWQPFAWMLGLSALMGASMLWSINPEGSLERALKTLPMLLSGALLFSMIPVFPAVSQFRKYFPVVLALAGTILYLDLYGGMLIFAPLHPSVPSVVSDGNYSGLNRSIVFYMLCIFPALGCISRDFRTPVFGLLALVTGLVFFHTDSQSAQMALLLGLVVYFLFPYDRKKIWIAAWGFLSTLIFAMPWIVQWGFKTFAAAIQTETGFLGHSYASIRLEIWDFIARQALKKPLTGWGADGTEHIPFDTTRVYYESEYAMHPHNFVLQLWIEYGVMGPLFASLFFGGLFYGIYKCERPAQRVLLASLCAAIVAAVTSYDLWQSWWLGAFGLLAAYSCLSAKSKA